MRPNIHEIRERNNELWNTLRNMLRRLVISTAEGVVWKLLGYEDYEGNVETVEAEVFGASATTPVRPARASRRRSAARSAARPTTWS